MKKLAFVAAALLLPISVLATTDASADNKPVLAPSQPIQIGPAQGSAILQLPVVKGTFTVPASLLTGGFTTISCNHIQVYASSKDMTTCGPNDGFCQPVSKWTRHATASGDIHTGSCNYAVIVPVNEKFSVSAASDFSQPNNCGYTYVQSSGTGAFLSVAPKEQKVHNFSVTSFSYQTCPR